MKDFFKKHQPELRQKLRTVLNEDVFKSRFGLTLDQERALTTQRIQRICDFITKNIPPEKYLKDLSVFSAIFEELHYCDLSLSIKAGVHFGLCFAAIRDLGNPTQAQKFLKGMMDYSIPGCFAMTELSHGSNVAALKTTATYDAAAQEFVIHTPDDSAQKFWIGNLANDGVIAVVFAQLIVAGVNHGVHAFIVPVRDMKTRKPMPGVTIADCGHKGGLHGVDNGRAWFNHVRIPRTNLLDRFGKVTEVGEYISPIQSKTKRFNKMLATLLGGRMGLSLGGNVVTKSALYIAIKFSLSRRQFGMRDKPEMRLIDYGLHQVRLFPFISKAYAIHCAGEYIEQAYLSLASPNPKMSAHDLHILLSGFKAYTSVVAFDAVHAARKACGGLGYAASSQFVRLRNDIDIYATFEGDNTVLMQQVVEHLAKQTTPKDMLSHMAHLIPLGSRFLVLGNSLA